MMPTSSTPNCYCRQMTAPPSESAERTLGRSGEGAARAGKWLGLLGACLGLTAALSLAFYGLLLWAEG